MTMPEPFLKGRFNLFETPIGGFHLSYRVDGEEEDRHMEIPPVIAEMMQGKVHPIKALRMLTGGKIPGV